MDDKVPTKEVYDTKLAAIKSNDPNLKDVNLNNLEGSKPEWMHDLLEALSTNTVCETVAIANCNINNEGGKKISDLLRSNTTITSLNIETNRIGADGIKAIVEALEVNATLKEIKITNQSTPAGNEVERLMAKCLEENKTLQKFSATIKDTASRNSVDRVISRNKELARKARQAHKQ